MTDKEYLKLLGKRIKQIRKEKGITQVELAKRIGTLHPQIVRIESGNINSSINILRKIAKELGISISELVKID